MTGLGGKERRRLRALGHALQPVVQAGKGGVTPRVIAATDEALAAHELVKVRRGAECPQTREEVASALASATGAEVVQTLGRTILLYRERAGAPQEP